MTHSAHPLAAARKRAGWSQTDLAVRAGLSLPTVQRYERGARGTHERWTALADALGVSVSSIQHGPHSAEPATDETSSNPALAGR